MKKWLALAGGAAIVGALFVPVGGGSAAEPSQAPRPEPVDLSAYSEARPSAALPLVFIHHSCGGQLLAPAGAERERERAHCIYDGHPNGGGLRALLEAQGYTVHEASYGSELGENTDLFDWPPKFRTKMDKILRVAQNDEVLPPGQLNRIVVFKSCFPNNDFVGEGRPPGDPAGPELTLANAKAALGAVLPELQKHPETLFVYVTAPANAPVAPPEPAWKWLAKTVLGKPHANEAIRGAAATARDFNRWAASRDGWLKDYPERNVVVFDYYDVLTGGGASNSSVFATGDGRDSHPSREGNERAAKLFVPFLNRAVRRAGLEARQASATAAPAADEPGGGAAP